MKTFFEEPVLMPILVKESDILTASDDEDPTGSGAGGGEQGTGGNG